MGKPKFKKKQKTSASKFLKAEPKATIDYDAKHPIFSFEKMQDRSGHSVSCCDREDLYHLLKRIYMLNRLPWRDIRQASRKGYGVEKIARSAIKYAVPTTVTDDNDYFHALHYSGKKRFIGYKVQQVFYILWIDHNFSVYDHG